MNLYRNIDRNKVQFDFLVHYKKRCFFDDEIEKMGGRIYRLSVREDFNLVKYIRDLNRFFKQHPEYKVIHGHMPAFAVLYFTVAKRNGVKFRISHSHSSSTERTLKGFFKRFPEKFAKYSANIYFACSNAAGRYLFGKRDYTLINNAIDIKRFMFHPEIRRQVRGEMGLGDRFVIGHVGRFSSEKNQTFLIDVFYRIHLKNPGALLMLIGTGSLLEQIRDKVNKMGLENDVVFLGVRKDVNRLYQAMDVFVLPSVFEGLPVSGVEAQAAGLQCIFSDAVTQQVKITGHTEFLSLKAPADNWADAILKWRNGYERHNEYQAIADSGYDISQEVYRLQGYYEKKYSFT